MKRLATVIGAAFLLLPTVAAAAESEICKALKDVQPVSTHYVKKVLVRADEGLKNLRSARANPGFERYLPSWARTIGETTNGLIDTYLNLTVEEHELLHTTACLHVDTLLLDCKIDEAQTEVQAQLKKNSIWGIIQAEALVEFLRERKVHLVRGALNPTYEDRAWNRQQEFDRSSSSSSASSSSSVPTMCPFDSDYAPPASDGYGCDASLLQKLSAYEPANKEREALDTLRKEVDRYKELSAEFSALEQELNALYEEDDLASAPEEPEEPLFNPDDPIGEDKQGEEGGHRELSGCQEESPPDSLRLRSTRSPFSYKKDEIEILSQFLGKRAAEGLFREQGDELKNPEEFEDKDEREKQEKRDSPLLMLFRNSARKFFQDVSGVQGKKEGAMFAATPDGTLEIANALTDLRKSVGELSRLAGTKEGLRSFVIKFAYFLRRTCIYRPCNTSLERVLRTAYADSCFPYTDGAFLKDTADDPRWQKCAKEACIEVEGVDLPDSCKDVGVE